MICHEIEFGYFNKFKKSFLEMVSITIRDNKDTLVHECAKFGQFEMFEYILDNWPEANVNA